MRKDFTIGKYDIELSNTALWPWTHFKIHKRESSVHIVWGLLALLIDDWTLEVYPVCAECGSADIGNVSAGDESWTVCRDCQSIEQGYKYLNKREYYANN